MLHMYIICVCECVRGDIYRAALLLFLLLFFSCFLALSFIFGFSLLFCFDFQTSRWDWRIFDVATQRIGGGGCIFCFFFLFLFCFFSLLFVDLFLFWRLVADNRNTHTRTIRNTRNKTQKKNKSNAKRKRTGKKLKNSRRFENVFVKVLNAARCCCCCCWSYWCQGYFFLFNLFLFTLWLALLTTNLEDSRRCCSCCCSAPASSSSWLVLFQLFSLLE